MSPSSVSPPSLVLSTLSKQQTRPKLPSPPDFSSERSSSQAFFNSCMLYLCLAPEQFSCNEEKIFWTFIFFKDGRAMRWSETSFARRQTLVSFLSNPGPTSNNSSRVNSFWSIRKQTPLMLWKAPHIIKETRQ